MSPSPAIVPTVNIGRDAATSTPSAGKHKHGNATKISLKATGHNLNDESPQHTFWGKKGTTFDFSKENVFVSSICRLDILKRILHPKVSNYITLVKVKY